MFRFIPLAFVLLGVILNISCAKKISDVELFTQATQLQREGKYDEAIGCYEKLVAKYAKSDYCPQAQFMIGFIYANELKDFEKAKIAYEKFLKDFPEHEMAKDARWEIDHLGKDISDIEELTSASSDTTNAKTDSSANK
jgi:outer membrane protein assembly factor BamD (BamD/ComL family)